VLKACKPVKPTNENSNKNAVSFIILRDSEA